MIKNTYEIFQNHVVIKMRSGMNTIIDIDDLDRVKNLNWFPNKSNSGYYARAEIGEQKRILLHKFILVCPNGMQVDHINHDTLDNRKSNLRIVSQSQNQWNQKPRNTKKGSVYKGVIYNKNNHNFNAQIVFNKKHYFLGAFKNEIDAAKAYDQKAVELFGDYAYLNFNGEINT